MDGVMLSLKSGSCIGGDDYHRHCVGLSPLLLTTTRVYCVQ